MTVKLSRYVFRKIGGRVVPIRIGAESLTTAKNASLSALRKLDGLMNKKSAIQVSNFVEGSAVKQKVFHGSNSVFSKFSHSKIGSSTGTSQGRGFYFTNDKSNARAYGKNVKEYYLSIKKPLVGTLNDGFKSNKLTEKQIGKIVHGSDLSNFGEGSSSHSVAKMINKYNTNDLDKIQDIGTGAFHHNWKKALAKVRSITGIDGSIAGNNKLTHYVAYNSDQIMKAPKKSNLYKKLKEYRTRIKK